VIEPEIERNPDEREERDDDRRPEGGVAGPAEPVDRVIEKQTEDRDHEQPPSERNQVKGR
jgi:hypothetical protein